MFAVSELRPLLIEIVRTLKLSYFSSWFKKEYENDTDKTTLLQLVGRDCDVLLSVMPAIITGLMNMYSTLRNNVHWVKEHLSEYQNFLVEQGFRFDETRWFGVGAFLNQGSEHMNKVLKRRLLRNATKNSWKYFQGLNGQIILALHNYGKQGTGADLFTLSSTRTSKNNTQKTAFFIIQTTRHITS